MRIEAQFFNAWNTAQFGPPNTTVTSADFGLITSSLLPPRQMQLSARILW